MENDKASYTLRVSPELLAKLGFVAEYEGRTKNKQIEYLIKKCIADFEREHGKIEEE
ncbi:MAG: hypothetical protein IJZ58_06000 [Oscillospiraceae bacterium]|nr:hypothetical protein [Oscillospiraceae bacterium]